jgi:hypothetical protein
MKCSSYIKGLKYNVHNKDRKWIKPLALEAVIVISNLDVTEQKPHAQTDTYNISGIY